MAMIFPSVNTRVPGQRSLSASPKAAAGPRERITGAATAAAWQRIRRAVRMCITATMTVALLWAQTAAVCAGGIIRDTEIEALIADYATPIFRAAGLGSQNINIHIIKDSSFNAFVIDGQNMFIHTGAILRTETPNQLIGVIAHETGHIAGGHVAQRKRQIARMESAALIINLLSIGAIVGGAVSGNNEVGQGGAAGLYAGSSVLERSLLSYVRGQESAADQAGVAFLTKTKQSAAGMLQTFQKLADQALGSLQFADPYLQTHPMPQNRIGDLRVLAETSPYYNVKDPPELQFRHDMCRAKLLAFVNQSNPQLVLRTYPERDQSLPARYARAITHYFTGGVKVAIPEIDRLIADQPHNPYFYELKGQFLLESGDVRGSIPPLLKAVELAPNAGLIRVMLAQAQIATNDPALLKDAIANLQKALTKEKQSALGYRQLAIAYGRLNRIPEAELASAQAFFYEGNADYAKFHAERAIKAFPEGSPNWNVANDVINDVEIYKKMLASSKGG